MLVGVGEDDAVGQADDHGVLVHRVLLSNPAGAPCQGPVAAPSSSRDSRALSIGMEAAKMVAA
jgi:hypothetical protein